MSVHLRNLTLVFNWGVIMFFFIMLCYLLANVVALTGQREDLNYVNKINECLNNYMRPGDANSSLLLMMSTLQKAPGEIICVSPP